MAEDKKDFRDQLGRFTSEGMKGRKHAKKDFTKEMAKHVTSREIDWVSKMLTLHTREELAIQLENGELEGQSSMCFMLIEKVLSGDVIALRFLCEMILGKPNQQIEQNVTGQVTAINFIPYKEEKNAGTNKKTE